MPDLFYFTRIFLSWLSKNIGVLGYASNFSKRRWATMKVSPSGDFIMTTSPGCDWSAGNFQRSSNPGLAQWTSTWVCQNEVYGIPLYPVRSIDSSSSSSWFFSDFSILLHRFPHFSHWICRKWRYLRATSTNFRGPFSMSQDDVTRCWSIEKAAPVDLWLGWLGWI